MNHYETLLYSKNDDVATITLNRPNDANCLNIVLCEELARAARNIDADPSIRAVIITGSGRFFCAGGDVNAMFAFGENLARDIKHLADEFHRALSTFARMKAMVIVAVNGTAAGAGFSLAVAGDFVLASESSSFTMAYSKIGLSPDGSSSYYLPRLVGIRRAQDLMYTNRVLTSKEALDWSLINRVVPDERLLIEAESLAKMFSNGASGSNGAIKKLMTHTFSNSLETQMELEGRLIAECAASDDGAEGIAAFNEKRRPNFKRTSI